MPAHTDPPTTPTPPGRTHPTPATLTAVGDARAALADRHGADDPAASRACPEWRLTALTTALSVISGALFSATPWQPPDTAALRTGLAELAAIALGWLDTLPGHPPDLPLPEDPGDALPF
jgi:hypothetical protein